VAPADWPTEERHDFSVRAGGRLVRGWYGLLAEAPPAGIEGGIRLYHLGRLVGAPEWFGHPGPAMHPGLNRLIGEVELPHVAVTLNKSDIDRGSPEWDALEVRLHRLLKPFVRRLTREEAVAASPGALRTAEQVRRILARALRMLESGQLFESELGSGPGSDVRGQLTMDSYATQPEAEADASQAERDEESGTSPQGPTPEPTAPPLRRGGAGPGRRNGVGDVVIRSLDPRLRSAMEVEDGVRRVVINSRYPLYEVRKGDLWYQLETALREVCATIPEATVPEFERRVNELMLVSLGLADRRRRTRSTRRTPGSSSELWPKG
jgi:hypothetical protein